MSIYQNHIDDIERIQKRFTRFLYRKFYYPYEDYKTRIVRLQMISLEYRRLLSDEMYLFKLKNGIFVTNVDLNFANNPRYSLRNLNIFRLPAVTNNVEYFSPVLRMHRQHMDYFSDINLQEPCFSAFKRYAIHEIKEVQYSMIRN